MAYQEITGGNGTTGQTGEVVKDIINANTAELYAAVEEEYSRAWTETLLFDKPEVYYAPYVQDDEINFELASSGHLVNASSGAVMIINADGVNPINFGAGFSFIYGMESGDVLDAGTYEIYFLYTNGTVRVNLPGTSSESSGLTKLSTPGSFAVVADGENALDLSWTDVANEVEYQIEKSLTGTGGWVLYSNPVAGSTSATETGLNPGDVIYYRIKALGDGVSYADSLYASSFGQTENSGDVTAPTFTFYPVNGEDEWTINRPITITANEPIRNDNGTTIDNTNVASVITLKQTNSGGANIGFSATIDATKTIITITPTTIFGGTQVVYVAVHDVEDFDGNEIASPISVTFTTTDWTYFNGTSNRLIFGDILDSIISIDNTNFEIEIMIRNHVASGTRIYVAKSDPTGNQRCISLFSIDTDIYFNYHQGGNVASGAVSTKWSGALTGAEQTIEVEYNGTVDTNYGMDRVTLKINGVTQGSKTTTNVTTPVTWYIFNSNAQLAVGLQVNSAGNPSSSQYFIGEAKDFKFRSASGATTNINVPLLAYGEDVSGNNLDGTWL